MRIVDLHCDTLSAILTGKRSLWENDCHLDVKRAREAGILLQFFALYSGKREYSPALRDCLVQVEGLLQTLEQFPDELLFIKTRQDLKELSADGTRMGCLLHLEGGEALGMEPEILVIFHRLGLRSLGLTWNYRNQLANGANEEDNRGGLSQKGREVLRYMEELGIVLDLAHIAPASFYDALEHYALPPLVTHANARALCSHRRNLDDSQIKALAERDGVIGVTYVNDFVSVTTPDIDKLIDHLVHIASLVGTRHLALGSDFDGADDMVLAGVQDLPALVNKLPERGFTAEDIENILWENALRVLNAVLPEV